MTVGRGELVLVASVALVFGAAPTVGDVGSCGQAATELDESSFGDARKRIDCARCQECALFTQACKNACDPNAPSGVSWPASCHPLERDGQVCLRALQAASCGDYTGFVDDLAPTEPSECDFCHVL